MTQMPPVQFLSSKLLPNSPSIVDSGANSAANIGVGGEDKLAYHHSAPHSAGAGSVEPPVHIIWCGGLKSDMNGTKAVALHEWAMAQGHGFTRFDYYGHGQSTGRFRDVGIGQWSQDVITVMDALSDADTPCVLVGSSMGGWAALLAALARKDKVKAMVLIAPAPDFTQKLMWESFDEVARRAIMEKGILYVPSDYDEPYEYSKELIEDGRKHLLLDGPIDFDGPVHILQGLQDDVVPWDYAQKVMACLQSDDVDMTLVKTGDHSLSRPEDITRLCKTLEAILSKF